MSRTLLAARRAGAPPTISISGTVSDGSVLTAVAANYASLQWYADGIAITGETGLTYTVDALDNTPTMGPDIICRATNPFGFTDSNALVYDDAGDLPSTAIFVSSQGVTQSGGTASSWAASYGGLACTMSAGAGTREPAYNASGGVGGRPILTTDGTDDGLAGTITKGSAWVDGECGVAGRRVSFIGAGAHWIGYCSGTTVRFGVQDNTVATFRGTVQGGASVVSTSDPDGVDAHYSMNATTGDQDVRKNGTAEDTATITFTSRADGSTCSIGTRDNAGANPSNFQYQAAYLGALLATTQRRNLRGLLTWLTGINC